MNTRSLLLLLCLSMGAMAQAQGLRINGFGGYTFQERFEISGTYNGRGVLDDGAHFGGSLEFMPSDEMGIELLYQVQPTTGGIEAFPFAFGPYEVNVNYIMLGGLRYAPLSDQVSGFGGLNLGVGFLTGEADASRFTVGGKLGLFIKATESVGLKLGAQFFSPVQGIGAGLSFGTGGSGVSVGSYSTILQFGFTGGLSFTLPSGS